MIAMKELRRLRRYAKLEKWWEEMDPNVTCNEQAMLLWDSVLRMLLDEAQDSSSDPKVAKENGGEVDASYERWYRAQLYLDKEGYEKRLNGIYELITEEDEEEGVEGKLEKKDEGNDLACTKVEEKYERKVETNRHKKRGILSIGKIH